MCGWMSVMRLKESSRAFENVKEGKKEEKDERETRGSKRGRHALALPLHFLFDCRLEKLFGFGFGFGSFSFFFFFRCLTPSHPSILHHIPTLAQTHPSITHHSPLHHVIFTHFKKGHSPSIDRRLRQAQANGQFKHICLYKKTSVRYWKNEQHGHHKTSWGCRSSSWPC